MDKKFLRNKDTVKNRQYISVVDSCSSLVIGEKYLRMYLFKSKKNT